MLVIFFGIAYYGDDINPLLINQVMILTPCSSIRWWY